jgi:hypothetical protein
MDDLSCRGCVFSRLLCGFQYVLYCAVDQESFVLSDVEVAPGTSPVAAPETSKLSASTKLSPTAQRFLGDVKNILGELADQIGTSADELDRCMNREKLGDWTTVKTQSDLQHISALSERGIACANGGLEITGVAMKAVGFKQTFQDSLLKCQHICKSNGWTLYHGELCNISLFLVGVLIRFADQDSCCAFRWRW